MELCYHFLRLWGGCSDVYGSLAEYIAHAAEKASEKRMEEEGWNKMWALVPFSGYWTRKNEFYYEEEDAIREEISQMKKPLGISRFSYDAFYVKAKNPDEIEMTAMILKGRLEDILQKRDPNIKVKFFGGRDFTSCQKSSGSS